MSITRNQEVWVIACRQPHFGLLVVDGSIANNPKTAWELAVKNHKLEISGIDQDLMKARLQSLGYKAIEVQLSTIIRKTKEERENAKRVRDDSGTVAEDHGRLPPCTTGCYPLRDAKEPAREGQFGLGGVG